MLHYKFMILTEYYKRLQKTPEEDLGTDAVGVVGVGEKLLDELFTLPIGLDPALEKVFFFFGETIIIYFWNTYLIFLQAIEDFTATKREREKKMKTLEEKAAAVFISFSY